MHNLCNYSMHAAEFTRDFCFLTQNRFVSEHQGYELAGALFMGSSCTISASDTARTGKMAIRRLPKRSGERYTGHFL